MTAGSHSNRRWSGGNFSFYSILNTNVREKVCKCWQLTNTSLWLNHKQMLMLSHPWCTASAYFIRTCGGWGHSTGHYWASWLGLRAGRLCISFTLVFHLWDKWKRALQPWLTARWSWNMMTTFESRWSSFQRMLIECTDVILVRTAGHPSLRYEHLNGAEQFHLRYCLYITINQPKAFSKHVTGGSFHFLSVKKCLCKKKFLVHLVLCLSSVFSFRCLVCFVFTRSLL